MDSVISPASRYLRALVARKKSEAFSKWKNNLPEFFFESFIMYGIKPFLEKYGYKLGFSNERCIQYCKQWAFAYLSRETVELVDCAHDADLLSEEYELYQHTISVLEWAEFAKAWSASEFLDSSDAGLKQLDDLNRFVWHCISLESSPTHLEWLESLEEEENADQLWIAEENQAYGGDRRTY